MFPGKLFREMVLEALVAHPQGGFPDPQGDNGDPQQQELDPLGSVGDPKDKRMVAPKRYRGTWQDIGKEMYDTYGPPEKYNIEQSMGAR